PRALGALDLARRAILWRDGGRALRPVATAQRTHRVPLPARRREARAGRSLQHVLTHPRTGRAAPGHRAPGHHRRPGPREERLPGGHQREQLLSVHLLEEMSMPSLDALDRERTLVVLTASPLEEHGPHLPLGVDAFTARHFAREVADSLVAA